MGWVRQGKTDQPSDEAEPDHRNNLGDQNCHLLLFLLLQSPFLSTSIEFKMFWVQDVLTRQSAPAGWPWSTGRGGGRGEGAAGRVH